MLLFVLACRIVSDYTDLPIDTVLEATEACIHLAEDVERACPLRYEQRACLDSCADLTERQVQRIGECYHANERCSNMVACLDDNGVVGCL